MSYMPPPEQSPAQASQACDPATSLIIFLHIPKTAGTTLSRIIRIKTGLWPPTRLLRHSLTFGYYQINPLEKRYEKIQSLSPARQRKIRLFQGHFGFGVHHYLPTPSCYVTMLRDPVERVISAYYQLRRGGEGATSNMTIDEFLTCGQDFGRFFVDNGQVRALTGTDGNPNPAPFNTLTEADLENAKRNIREHCAFVGLSERFDESLLLLRRILGWRTCYYASANVARDRKKLDELPAKTVDLIHRYNQLDIELYRHVSKSFDELIERQGDSFAAELQRFQARNRLYTRFVGPVIDLLPAAKRLGQKTGIVR